MSKPRHSDESLRALILEDPDLTSASKDKVVSNLRDLQIKFGGPRSLFAAITSPDRLIPELYKQKWSNHRLCGMINAPLSVYKRAPWLQTGHEKEWKRWQEERHKVQTEIDEEYEKNEGSQRYEKAAIPWSQLVKKRDSLPKGSKERLLISFYTMIPPARANYGDLLIFTEKPDDPTKIGEAQNYIVLTKQENYIALRKYKTAGTYHENRVDIPSDLVKEIQESLKHYPRQHIFVGLDGKPFHSENSFSKFACRVLEKVYDRPGLTITILRRMFISNKENPIHEKSWAEKKEIARAMGHDIMCQQKIYLVKGSHAK